MHWLLGHLSSNFKKSVLSQSNIISMTQECGARIGYNNMKEMW